MDAITFPTVDALVSAVLEEDESATRTAILRANRALLTGPVLLGIAEQGSELASAGETERALKAFAFGAEAAEAADHPSARLMLLMRIAALREQVGPPEAALDALEHAYLAARALVEAGGLKALGVILNISGRAAELARTQGDLKRGRALLSEARRLARSVNSSNVELWILRNLILLTVGGQEADDWTSAQGYALEAGRLLSAPAAARPGEPPAPDPAAYAEILRLLSTRAYESEDFEMSASLARVWRLTAPGNADATRELALSAMRTGQFAEAEGLWRELLIGAPGDASLHANLAGSMSAQRRYAEATEALDRAIELAPDDVKFRRFRVQMKRASGDLAGAVADLGGIIARCEAALAPAPGPTAGADEPPAAARSRLEYERNMPLRDVLDLALFERAVLYEDMGDLTHALEDLGRLAREADAATAAHALRDRSRIFSARGEPDQALTALREAVQRAPQDSQSVMALGRSLAEAREDAEAVQVLSRLVQHDDLAAQVVTTLTPVVDRAPSNVQARLVRGFAAETAGHPGIADGDFSVVLEQDSSNAHMFYRRGRVRLMSGNGPEDEAWNNSLTPERVLQAAHDFARAVTLDPADEDARHSLRWLVDRICTAWRFHPVFRSAADEGVRAILEVFPTLGEALQRFFPAVDLASRGEYQEALEQWRLLQNRLLEIPMPVSACRIDMYIADSLLRLYDLQGALEHLDRAAQLIFLVGQPMSRALEQQAAETRRRTIRESGQPAVVLETELANVYPFFTEDMPRRVDMLRIDALGRLGDFEQMLQLLDKDPELEQNPDSELVNMQLNLAARLRDAGLQERALALVDRLEPVVPDASYRAKFLNLRGSIHMNLRHLDAAEADFRAALTREMRSAPEFAPLISLNLARVLVEQERFADARDVLDAAKGTLDEATPFEEMGYRWLLAETAIGLDEIDPAKAEVERALGLAEQLRGAFHDPTNRIAWQGRLTALYDLAVYIAMKAGDLALTFDLVERTRARAYLDVMRTGVGATPDSAKELVDSLDALRTRRDTLWQLDKTMRLHGSTFVDMELVGALASQASDLTVVQRLSSGRQVISPSRLAEALTETNEAIARIEERIDAARTAASVAAVGAPLDTAALAALLAGGGATDPSAGGGQSEAIVLVEFFQFRGVVCCLVMRSGETVPSLHLVEATSDDIAALATRAPWGDADADTDDTWQALLSTIAAGAIERSNPGDLLWIVPYGPLHQVPLHAALVGDVPLLVRNPVCYSSSASALPASLERSRGTYASAIVFGDARDDLPFARAESLSVAARFGTEAVVGTAATEKAFMDALAAAGDRVDVLHLATHGTFDADDALDSGIELAGGGGETTRLTARDIARGELPAELVTLSACESGRTRVFAGDEPVGLTRAFLSAGASAVLATLWLTNDLSTRLIVERFYDALQQAPAGDVRRWRKADALRDASLAVRAMTLGDLLNHGDAGVAAFAREMAVDRALRDSDRPFAAPRLWAPFALVGAWT